MTVRDSSHKQVSERCEKNKNGAKNGHHVNMGMRPGYTSPNCPLTSCFVVCVQITNPALWESAAAEKLNKLPIFIRLARGRIGSWNKSFLISTHKLFQEGTHTPSHRREAVPLPTGLRCSPAREDQISTGPVCNQIRNRWRPLRLGSLRNPLSNIKNRTRHREFVFAF